MPRRRSNASCGPSSASRPRMATTAPGAAAAGQRTRAGAFTSTRSPRTRAAATRVPKARVRGCSSSVARAAICAGTTSAVRSIAASRASAITAPASSAAIRPRASAPCWTASRTSATPAASSAGERGPLSSPATSAASSAWRGWAASASRAAARSALVRRPAQRCGESLSLRDPDSPRPGRRSRTRDIGSHRHERGQRRQPLGADAGHLPQLLDAAETAVLLAVVEDPLRDPRPDAVERVELLDAWRC